MSNPFYPPNSSSYSHSHSHTSSQSKGRFASGNEQQAVAFDPDRRAGPNLTRHDHSMHHSRDGTEGPTGAALFYSQDAPLAGDVPAFGTGTDGFGGGESHEYEARDAPPYIYDYRHEYVQGQQRRRGADVGGDDGRKQAAYTAAELQQSLRGPYLEPAFSTPRYEDDSPQAQALLLADNSTYPPLASHNQRQHLYPPQQMLHPGSMDDISRPDTPGFYPDRAPKMEKLTDPQKKITKQFPDDLDEENGSLLKTAKAMIMDWRSWLKIKYIPYYIILIIIVLLVAFMTIYHRQIIDWLTPVSQKVRSVAWGFIIPVVILFIISFPPLFGHEIVGVLLGVVYGLWIGFAILSLGTLLGEWGNFYAFKYFLKSHAERYERRSLNYACMAYIVREGGFVIVLLARLSAIPGHFTTAVFATVGMGFFVFTLATLLSMPKQLLIVYLGVAIEQSGSGTEPTKSKIIKYAVIVVSGLVTVAVAVYLYGQMQKARPKVQAQLREKRYQMLTEAANAPESQSDEIMAVEGADESTVKFYGHGSTGMYSTDDLESSGAAERKRKGKGASMWKWGRRNKNKREETVPLPEAASMESLRSLEKGKDTFPPQQVPIRRSYDDSNQGHWDMQDTLRHQDMHGGPERQQRWQPPPQNMPVHAQEYPPHSAHSVMQPSQGQRTGYGGKSGAVRGGRRPNDDYAL